VLACALAAGGGAVLGRTTAPAVLASASTSAVPGTRSAAATDAETGATMTVAVRPAAGWVRVHAAVGGVPVGEQCRLYVVARDGSRQQAASWLVDDAGAAAGTTLDGSALIAPADVAAVQAETLAGEILVVVPV
jgi:RNA polymerase sigma-70 factor (ECF subfamily)